MALSAEQIVQGLNEVGLDSKEKFLALIAGAIKPIEQAKIREQIAARQAAFAAEQKKFNEDIAALNAQLNAL